MPPRGDLTWVGGLASRFVTAFTKGSQAPKGEFVRAIGIAFLVSSLGCSVLGHAPEVVSR